MSESNDLVKAWRDMGPAAWAEHRGGWIGEDGQPIRLYPWQRALLEAWWEHREAITTLGISNIKKTGKTLVNAALLCWRWLALPGEHFAVGNDLDQSAGRQFAAIAEMVKHHPYLSANVSITRTLLRFEPTGSTIEALASDAAGNAGANHMTASHTESWGILYEAGIRAWEELTPPPGRRHGLPPMRIADSYAGWEGESKTWHNLVDRGLAGRRISEAWPIFQDGGLLLFHAEGEEAQARCFPGTSEEAAAYYQDQRSSMRANAFVRMHQNQRTQAESGFVALSDWDALVDPELRPVAPGVPMVLGADASTRHDTTALVGVGWSGERRRAELAYFRCWDPHVLGKLDPDRTIGDAVRTLREQGHSIKAVVCDPWQMVTTMEALKRLGIAAIELAQGAPRVEADQQLWEAVMHRTLATFPEPTLRQHVVNAVAVEGLRGFRIAKERATRPIDGLVALSMAHLGALQMLAYREPVRMTVSPNPFYGAAGPLRTPAGFEGNPSLTTDGDGTLRFLGPHQEPGITWETCYYYQQHRCTPCEREWRAWRREKKAQEVHA